MSLSFYFLFCQLFLQHSKPSFCPWMKTCYHITSLLLNCRSINRGQLYTQSELLLLLTFSRLEIYVATWKHRQLALSRMRSCHNSQNGLLLENYVDEWLYRYIWVRCSYVCHTKQGRKTCALLGISWHHRMCDVTAKVLHRLSSMYLL